MLSVSVRVFILLPPRFNIECKSFLVKRSPNGSLPTAGRSCEQVLSDGTYLWLGNRSSDALRPHARRAPARRRRIGQSFPQSARPVYRRGSVRIFRDRGLPTVCASRRGRSIHQEFVAVPGAI